MFPKLILKRITELNNKQVFNVKSDNGVCFNRTKIASYAFFPNSADVKKLF